MEISRKDNVLRFPSVITDTGAMKKRDPGFIYIAQARLDRYRCKIGITKNLEQRLDQYNRDTTGRSKTDKFDYLFKAKVKSMSEVEQDLKEEYSAMREENNREVYFYNRTWHSKYVDFIKHHDAFDKELPVNHPQPEVKITTKIVQAYSPSLKERGISARDVLQKAKSVKNDEFFTRYEDVKKEVEMYPVEVWKNKCVFCNCDDPVGENKTERDSSAFALYFLENFKRLKLKKLICTHYANPVDLFNAGPKGYIFTKSGYKELKDFPEGYNGDFAHEYSLKILKEEADIVCTNPPFSLMKKFWEILIASGKKFLIISNITNAKNASYMHFIRDKKIWAGFNSVDWFLTPKQVKTRAAGHWYTNFKIKDRPKWKSLKFMPLKEIPKKFIRWDDNHILSVDNGYIPTDYSQQFVISPRIILNGILEKGFELVHVTEYVPYFNGKRSFGRVLIRRIKTTSKKAA